MGKASSLPSIVVRTGICLGKIIDVVFFPRPPGQKPGCETRKERNVVFFPGSAGRKAELGDSGGKGIWLTIATCIHGTALLRH
jgi:hypothetical protein